MHGIEQINECIDVHGLDCDFKENSMLDVAMDDAQVKIMENEGRNLKEWGLDVEMLYGKELEKEIVNNIPRRGGRRTIWS